MRERSILLDIAVLFLLLATVIVSGIMMLQNDNLETQVLEEQKLSRQAIEVTRDSASNLQRQFAELNSQLLRQQELTRQAIEQSRDLLARISQGAAVNIQALPAGSLPPISSNTTAAGNSASSDIVPVTGKIYDNSTRPNFVRGDEKADDGDTLVVREPAEPNSLNYMIDNDAFLGHLYEKVANEWLATRAYDDLKTWEGRLARAWEKSMVCRGLAKDKNAPELAKKLEAALDDATRKRLNISKISAESNDVVRIELSDVKGDYREEVLKILGPSAVEQQTWIYVSYESGTFTDGQDITSASVVKRLQEHVAAHGFKGRFLPAWERETSVVIQVVGDADSAEKAIREFISSPRNAGDMIDPKATTGKRRDKVLTFDIVEKYDFEERPIFTFHLLKNVKWHDGVPFTGRDVVWSFQTIKNKNIECGPLRQLFVDCESVKLVNNDPHIVQFVWKKPYALSFSRSASITILPEHVYKFTEAKQFNQGKQNQSFVGLGPYKFERWDRKQSMAFVRNPDYHGPRPHFSKILMKFVNDNTVAVQMQRAEGLDYNDMILPTQMEALEKDQDFQKKNITDVSGQLAYNYIGWNLRRDMFSGVKTRRALTLMIDRQRIIEDLARGYGIPMYGPCHPDSPIYSKDIEKYAFNYNPAEAKRLLAEDGWKDTNGDNVLDRNGKPFKFNLIIRTGDVTGVSIANMVKDTFEDAGIVVNVDLVEWSILLQRVERHEFDAVRLGWRLTLDDDPYQLWHSSQCGEKASNHAGYKNPEVDRLIEAGRRELVDEKRIELFRKAYEQIAADQPYTFLYTPKRLVGYSRRIKNAVFKLTEPEYVRWWVPNAAQKDPG